MQLLLHIGMGKTGTSTLQNTFRSEAELLRSGGVVYPIINSRPNHNGLTCSLLPPHELAREFRSGAYADAGTVRRFGDEFWAGIEQSARSSGAHAVVLSAEYLFHMRSEHVARMSKLLRTAFDDIRVIAYVRQPAAYYVSVIQQKVRASYAIAPPSRYKVRYKNRLTNYVNAFGKDNVAVRVFDASMLEDGCVVRDFLINYVPGGRTLAEEISVTRVNESISAEAMCIMQDFRRYGWPHDNDVFAPESQLLLKLLRGIECHIPQTRPRLKPEFEAALTDRHEAELTWLERKFGVVFPPAASYEGVNVEDTPGWRSQRLLDILDVERAQVDATLYVLVKELARARARPA